MKLKSKTIASLCAAGAVYSAGTPFHASAQSQADSRLEEILVTARKKEERLQEVPLTVNVLTSEQLDRAGIQDLQNVADFTPGLDFSQAFGRQDFRPAIRGQSTIQGGANAGLFVDGFFIGAGRATLPLNAIERVEVVKGPQAAQFGRSTLAGAINYVLKKPTEEFEGALQLDIAEHEENRADIRVSGPISDSVGYMLSASYYTYGGEYTNNFQGNGLGTPANNDDIGGEESLDLAAVLTFQPSDTFDATLRVLVGETDDDPYAIALQPSTFNNCFDEAPPPAPPGTPAADANNIDLAAYNTSGYYCGEVDVGQVLAENGGGTNLETRFFDDMGTEVDSQRVSLSLNWELGGNTLSFNTSYHEVETRAAQDQTFGGGDTQLPIIGLGSPTNVFPFGGDTVPTEVRVGFLTDDESDFEEYSQELRFTSPQDGRLRYLAGAYFYKSESGFKQRLSSDTRLGTDPNSGLDLFSPFAFPPEPTTRSYSAFFEGAPYIDGSDDEVESWSVFGAIEYDLSETVSAGLELRYNEDEITISGGPDNLDFSETYDNVLPRFTFDWQYQESHMLYAVLAKGNKPGDLNTSEGLSDADRAVEEEEALTYELGNKSQFLDGRIQFNTALYLIDWEDQQLTSTRSQIVDGDPRTISILENVGESEIKGLEVELLARVLSFWDLYLGAAYTDSEIEEFRFSIDADADAPSSLREAATIFGFEQSTGDVVISGTELPQVSKYQATFSNTFFGVLNNGWEWFAKADYLYNSKRYAQVYNLAHTGERHIVNLRAGLDIEQLGIELWMKNATDDDTPTQIIRYVEANDLTFNPFNRAFGVTLPRGRQVGLTVNYRF